MSRDEGELPGLNILCFDSGGARGLSSLVVLGEFMYRLKCFKQINGPLIPADHFDYIAGSGTGGISACLVGKLRMSTDKAIQEYAKVMKAVFTEKKLLGSTKYKATNLQQALSTMVREATGNEDEKMLGKGREDEKCKTAVFAMTRKNMNACLPVIFRSYQGDDNPSPDCTISEALQATMAHPDLFKSVDISDHSLKQSFVGGEIGCSNPIAHVLSEVKKLYPNRHVASILSIGAGHARTIQVPDSNPLQRLFGTRSVVAMKQMATDSERVAEEMAIRFAARKGVYFRFNVDQGMQSMLPGNWEQLSEVSANTKAYLRGFEVERIMKQATQSTSERQARIPTEFIDGHIPGHGAKRVTRLKLCPAPTPIYTGREAESRQLEDCLTRSEDERCICVVYGLGGVGKTQLALNVIERTHDKWDSIIYIDASSEGAIKKALQDYASFECIGETHEDAISWLKACQKRWLLVLDNADDRSLVTGIRQFIPGGRRAKVIITTRLTDMAVLAKGVDSICHLSNMNQEDGFALLMKTARMEGKILSDVEKDAAIALLQDFGYLSLAIVHAGAYMAHVRSMTITEYRDRFLSKRHSIHEHPGKLHENIDDYGKPVYASWKLCYELLQEPSKQMLWLMAFLHCNHISEDLFKRAAQNVHIYKRQLVGSLAESQLTAYNCVKNLLSIFLDSEGSWDTVRFADIMAGLTSCSLVNFDQMNLAYSIHILVQDWVRTVIPRTTESPLACTETLLSISMVGLQDDAESFSFERQLWLHVNNIIENRYEIGVGHGSDFSYICLRMGQWDQAEELAKRDVDTYKQRLGETHPAVCASMVYLALTFLSLGQGVKAEKLGVQVLNMCEEILDEGHPMTLKAKQCLSEIYARNGRLDEAKQLQIETLHIYNIWLQSSIPLPDEYITDILQAMVLLASTYSALTQWDMAERVWTRILTVQEKLLGEDHLDTLDTLNHLAIAHSFRGHHDAAERLRERIISARNQLWRESHPRILSSMEFYAVNNALLGRLEEAMRLLVRVMNARIRLLGEEHPDTLNSMQRAAMVYTELGKGEEAEWLLNKAVGVSERKLGREHPDTQIYRSHLAQTKKLNKSMKYYQERQTILFISLLLIVFFTNIWVIVHTVSSL